MQVIKFKTESFLDDPKGNEVFVEATRVSDELFLMEDVWQISHDFGDFYWHGKINDIIKETRKVLKIKESLKQIKKKLIAC